MPAMPRSTVLAVIYVPDGAMYLFRFLSSFMVPPSAFQVSKSALDAISWSARAAILLSEPGEQTIIVQ